MTRTVLFLVFLFAALGVTSCDSSPEEPQPKNGFPGKVAVVIESNCLGGSCHSSPTKDNGGLDLSSWEAMMKGDSVVNDVIPFNARLSYLFQHINTNRDRGEKALPRMPLARDPLSDEDQKIIFDWINDGAKSSGGKIAYAEVTEKYFVPNQGEDVLSVIDGATNRLIRAEQFPTGSEPACATTDLSKQFLFVGFQNNTGSIKKLRVSDYSVVQEFQSSLVPSKLVILPSGAKGYISSYPSAFKNRIGVFDPVGMKMIKVIETPLLRSSYAMISSKDGKYLFVTGYESDNVLVINTSNDSVVANMRLGEDVPVAPDETYMTKYNPSSLALSADEKFLFVSSTNTREVIVFDVGSFSLKQAIDVEVFPRGMMVESNSNELWVVNNGSNDISIIDLATLEVTTIIETVGSGPASIEFSPDGSLAYIACLAKAGSSHHSGGSPKSSVFVLNRATRKIIKEIEMPAYSADIVRGF